LKRKPIASKTGAGAAGTAEIDPPRSSSGQASSTSCAVAGDDLDLDEGFDDPDEDDADEDDADDPSADLDEQRRQINRRKARSGDVIDDPIRMYLMQMGEIPMLSREEEISVAKEIDRARLRYRHSLLASDYVLQGAVAALEKVRDGRTRLDRTVDISVSNAVQRRKLLRRMIPNLKTLRHLLVQNHRDFRIAISRSQPGTARRDAWRRLVRRRNKAVRLVEELDLRTTRLDPLLAKLRKISDRMETLLELIEQAQREGSAGGKTVDELRSELRYLMRATLESPSTLRRRHRKTAQYQAQYDEARRKLSAGNLRLVVSVAKKYRNRGLSFLDLIQEGNTGLMRAVDKYEHFRGYKFSTYATWWIRQAVSRAVADQSRTIRVPVHMIDAMGKVRLVTRTLVQELGREPSPEETAERAEMTLLDTERIMRMTRAPLSLDQPVGEQEDTFFGDFLEDETQVDPLYETNQQALKGQIDDVLKVLNHREREVLRLRYGLVDGYAYTLEEVGKIFSVTRERVRQIESKAVHKLQQPFRRRQLIGFLDGEAKKAKAAKEGKSADNSKKAAADTA